MLISQKFLGFDSTTNAVASNVQIQIRQAAKKA